MFSQQTASSTSDEARRSELVAALERAQGEVKAARLYIDGLKGQIKSKQARIDALDERDVARVKVQESLQAEVKDLLAAVASQKETIRIKTEEADYLKKELTKVNKKLKAAHTREKVLGGVAAVLLTLLLLR